MNHTPGVTIVSYEHFMYAGLKKEEHLIPGPVCQFHRKRLYQIEYRRRDSVIMVRPSCSLSLGSCLSSIGVLFARAAKLPGQSTTPLPQSRNTARKIRLA